MLNFKTISYKNFLSAGNEPIKIVLDDSNITVISGKNGYGKSAIIDAIFFAIYGKAFRKVNKESLINSINKKNTLVEIILEQNGTIYKIIRGIKPNIFEIYINDSLKSQDANVKDYQKWLIDNIVHMDEKTFRQIIIMGSTSYVPFMRLNASERRTVIEDILHIDIITQMNQIAKTRASEMNREFYSIQHKEKELLYKIDSIKAATQSIDASIDNTLQNINNSLHELKKEAEETLKNTVILKQLSNPEEHKSIIEQIKKIEEFTKSASKKLYSHEHSYKTIEKDESFFKNNSVCPYCTQELSTFFVEEKINQLEYIKKTEKDTIYSINTSIAEIENKKIILSTRLDELYEIERKINNSYSTIDNIKQKIVFYNKEKETYLKKKNTEIIDNTELLNNLYIRLDVIKKELIDIKQKLSCYDIIFSLLKDDGIKTIIIKNYLGIINALIKKYLSIVGYNISFSFDENFSETIKSRAKDVFEYNSFSEGERMRIDFCLLFAFRELAKLRSTINTNLLIIDEQDGRLDNDGVASMNMLLSSMNGNLIIISQYPEVYDEISSKHISIYKENDFSYIETI